MGPVVAIVGDEGAEACLLLEDVGGRGLGRVPLEREMHPLMATILLRLPRLNALETNRAVANGG